MIGRATIVVLIAAVAAIAIVANLALLDFASAGNDPVGKAQAPGARAQRARSSCLGDPAARWASHGRRRRRLAGLGALRPPDGLAARWRLP